MRTCIFLPGLTLRSFNFLRLFQLTQRAISLAKRRVNSEISLSLLKVEQKTKRKRETRGETGKRTGRNFEWEERTRGGEFFSNPLSEIAFHSRRSFHIYRSRPLRPRHSFFFFSVLLPSRPNFVSPGKKDIEDTVHWLSTATVSQVLSTIYRQCYRM